MHSLSWETRCLLFEAFSTRNLRHRCLKFQSHGQAFAKQPVTEEYITGGNSFLRVGNNAGSLNSLKLYMSTLSSQTLKSFTCYDRWSYHLQFAPLREHKCTVSVLHLCDFTRPFFINDQSFRLFSFVVFVVIIGN